MKCPLLSKVYIEEPERSNTDICDCLQEACAWWVEYFSVNAQARSACAIAANALINDERLTALREGPKP